MDRPGTNYRALFRTCALPTAASIHAARIATGEAHAVLGGDLVVSGEQRSLVQNAGRQNARGGRLHQTPTAEFTRHHNWQFPGAGLMRQLSDALGSAGVDPFDTQRLATRLIGDALCANLLLLATPGNKAWCGLPAALDKAIELNGGAVEADRRGLWLGAARTLLPEKSPAIAGPLARGEHPAAITDGIDSTRRPPERLSG